MEPLLYKGFLLSPAPMQEADGRFQPRIGVTAMGGDRTRAQRFLDLPLSFDTEAEAVARAIEVGKRWVDDNGDAPSATTALSSSGPRLPPR